MMISILFNRNIFLIIFYYFFFVLYFHIFVVRIFLFFVHPFNRARLTILLVCFLNLVKTIVMPKNLAV